MDPPPRVSIVMPFLNPGRFFPEAIDSVIGQTYRSWELHLVNDGSSDNSQEVAEDFARRHPGRIFTHQHRGCLNLGAAASRNVGVHASRGEFLAFLDADDVWFPDSLEHRVRLLDTFPAADAACGATEYWHGWTGDPNDAANDTVAELALEPETVLLPPLLATLNYPLGTGPAPTPNALLVRRGAFDRIGGFEDTFSGIFGMYEDQAFLIKLYLNCALVASDKCWDRYRQHPGSICARVTGAGQYELVREQFLVWLGEYLRRAGISDHAVWAAVAEARRTNADPGQAGRGATSISPTWRQRTIAGEPSRQDKDASARGFVPVVFGDEVVLTAATTTRLTTGGLKLGLDWKSLRPLSLSNHVAVHLVDRAGDIRAQADYPQDQGLGPVAAGATWRDTLALPPERLQGAEAIALGICRPDGELVPADARRTDWGGRRVWLDLEPSALAV